MSAIKRLKQAGVENPARDIRILEANFKGKALEEAITRRENREPISHILGYRDFWKDRFIVTPDVLDPRPDSELFIELALEHAAPERVLDLGCGSGALGLSLLREYPQAHCLFADISLAALDVAQKNAEALGLLTGASFLHSNWFKNIEGKFNLILCNPPYIPAKEMKELSKELEYEPRIALSDEDDGLSAYRILAQEIGHYFMPDAVLFVEHGHEQQEEVAAIFEKEAYRVKKHKDLNNKPRICAIYQ